MAAPTTQELLDSVNSAIKAILDAGAVVSYEIGDRGLKRAELSDLLNLRRELQAQNIPTGGLRLHVEFVEPDGVSRWE